MIYANPFLRPNLLLIICLCSATLLSVATAQAPLESNRVHTEHVTARLIAERMRVRPGERVDLALVLDLRPHWHSYWRNPGDSGEPPVIRWQLPSGVQASPIRWPAPTLIPVGPLANYGYSRRATHLVELHIPAQWPAGKSIQVRADATWLVCNEECVPEQGRFVLTLATDEAEQPSPLYSEAESVKIAALFAAARAALPAPGTIAAALIQDDGLHLQVPRAALPSGIIDAWFFADAWGLIEHSAEQHWRLQEDLLLLHLVPGATPDKVAPTGLLVVEHQDGRTAFEIDARALGLAPSVIGEPDSNAAGGSGLPTPNTQSASASVAAGMNLPLALLFALLGGLILNLMPCVFPILAIKALGLAQQARVPTRERWFHATSYGAGVLTFFTLVALLLLGLRAGGAALGWGFQLQSPVFVVLMAYLFLVLGLSLTGALTIGTGLMGIGVSQPNRDRQAGHDGVYRGAFVTGALAALVAAPCTAPFMGTALGYALMQPWPFALAVILMLGIGMALPFMLLALLPSLASRLPRPGKWMDYLKQLLAFPMFATAAWLVWVLSIQTGSAGVAAVLAGMILLSLALWLLDVTRNSSTSWRRLATGSAAISLAGAFWLSIDTARLAVPADLDGEGSVAGTLHTASQSGTLHAAPYSAQALAAARATERPVFVNMTAAWCITCLVNERIALTGSAVASAFSEHGVLYLKGDWTQRDPNITDYLAGFGRNGVPLYVFYPSRAEPYVLPQILTESIVLDALQQQ